MTDAMREKARALLAPHFATDGEEEDERIAQSVERLIVEIAAALTAAYAAGERAGLHWQPIETIAYQSEVDFWFPQSQHLPACSQFATYYDGWNFTSEYVQRLVDDGKISPTHWRLPCGPDRDLLPEEPKP